MNQSKLQDLLLQNKKSVQQTIFKNFYKKHLKLIAQSYDQSKKSTAKLNISDIFKGVPQKVGKTETSANKHSPLKDLIIRKKQSLSPYHGNPYEQKQKWFPASHPNILISNLYASQKDFRNLIQNEDQEIKVIVHYQEQTLEYKININNNRKTTSQLIEYIKNELMKAMPENVDGINQIINFITISKNIPIDYYLSLQDRSLKRFQNQILRLQPYINIYKPTNQKVTLKDFIFFKCIGVGGFSRVYLVKKKSNGLFYAMKLIDKEQMIIKQTQGIVQNERNIMSVISHPFLIKLEYAFECRNFVVFVCEFSSGSELFQQLKQVKRMTENQAKFYFTEICLGMLYLHQLNVVYRDVKPENILLDIDGHVRIADFGLSKPNMDEEEYAYSFCGSPEYMAPEMLLKTGHNIQVDHYCLGVLLYELVTGLPPYYSKNVKEIYNSILKEDLNFPSDLILSSEIKSLLHCLLNKNPENRLGKNGGILQILSHKWFTSIDLMQVLYKKIDPPFIPNQLQFHIADNSKGEAETLEKLLGKRGLPDDVRIFKDFYFDQNEESLLKKEQDKFYQNYVQMIKQYQNQKNRQSTSTSQGRKLSLTKKQPSLSSTKKKKIQSRIDFQQGQINKTSNKIIQLKRMVTTNNYFTDRNGLTGLVSSKRNNSHQYDSSILASNHQNLQITPLQVLNYQTKKGIYLTKQLKENFNLDFFIFMNQYCELYYTDNKPDEYTHILLFIHGNLVNSKCWQRLTTQIAKLNPKLRMICVDLRSFGKSQSVTNYESIQELAGDVIHLIDKKLIQGEQVPLNYIKQNLITIGWSLGGAVTLRLAVDYADYIGKIVLLGSCGVCGIPITYMDDYTRRCQSKQEIKDKAIGGIMEQILETKNKEKLGAQFQQVLFIEKQEQAILDELVEQSFQQSNYIDSLNALNTFDISAGKEDKAKNIQGPVLIYHGKQDPIVNTIQAEGIAKEIGEDKCKLVIRENVSHGMVYENVEDVGQVIVDFVQQ